MILPDTKLSKDAKKVLDILQKAGPRGILATDLKKMEFGKDRSFVARIDDLKNKFHYDITSVRVTIGDSWTCRYTLNEGPRVRPQYILIDELTKKRYTQDFVEINIPRQEALV